MCGGADPRPVIPSFLAMDCKLALKIESKLSGEAGPTPVPFLGPGSGSCLSLTPRSSVKSAHPQHENEAGFVQIGAPQSTPRPSQGQTGLQTSPLMPAGLTSGMEATGD